MSRLWYQKPAEVWEEALPLGNGRMGAMVFGGIRQERIQVNEESIWYGGPVDRINPDALEHLEEIREHIFAGRIQEAQNLMNLTMAGCPDSMHPYQTLGDIQILFNGLGTIGKYERSLNLDEAVCRTEFESNGVHYRRTMFLSHPEDCLIMHFTANAEAKISFQANLSRGKYFDGKQKLGENGICLYGNLGKGGNDFAMGMKAWAKGGQVQVVGCSLCVENADEVLLLFCADSTYQHVKNLRRDEETGGKAKQALQEIMHTAIRYTFEELLERHRRDYQSLFARVEFWLKGAEEYDKIPTDVRIKSAVDGQADIGLSKMLFDYGRYLLISCSRPGGLPATLQGIWNQDFLPPWDSKYTININTEMNYWPAESCNLSECHLPLFDLLEKMVENGKRTAKTMYGCRGFVAHHNTDIHGDTAPQDTWYPATYWVMGAAWLCTHMWTHYQYTLDLEFLKKSYPVMCEAALFFLDFLVEKDGYLVTCPSLSPENSYRLPDGEEGAVSYGVTMDNQILRDLFTQCLESGKILEAENTEFLNEVEEALKKLPPTKIGSDGRILEWVKEYEECEPGHRHISHLYGLHPSEQITMDGTPELAEAARKTLEVRLNNGGGHTGWSRAWIINHYAKLWDGEHAYHHIEQMLAASTYPNLFDRHPPFQIDGNFGVTAAIAEMLVQSTAERIVLLPALPQAWEEGSVKGLRIKGNAEISLKWKDHKLSECVIHAYDDFSICVRYENRMTKVSLRRGEIQRFVV